MPTTLRNYMDRNVPVIPARRRQRTWQQAWNNLSRQLFVVTPNQLDRAREYRNRFIRAVQ